MKKVRVVAFLLALLMVLAALPLTASAASKTMYVKTDDGLSLNVRSSMKTKTDNVITKLTYGTKVTVLSESGSWARITWGSKSSNKGYVVKKYLSSSKPSGTSGSSYRYVKTSSGVGANMRSAMNTRNSTILLTVPEGNRVKVLATYSRWCKVSYKNKTGYILSSLLSTKK